MRLRKASLLFLFNMDLKASKELVFYWCCCLLLVLLSLLFFSLPLCNVRVLYKKFLGRHSIHWFECMIMVISSIQQTLPIFRLFLVRLNVISQQKFIFLYSFLPWVIEENLVRESQYFLMKNISFIMAILSSPCLFS